MHKENEELHGWISRETMKHAEMAMNQGALQS